MFPRVISKHNPINNYMEKKINNLIINLSLILILEIPVLSLYYLYIDILWRGGEVFQVILLKKKKKKKKKKDNTYHY